MILVQILLDYEKAVCYDRKRLTSVNYSPDLIFSVLCFTDSGYLKRAASKHLF